MTWKLKKTQNYLEDLLLNPKILNFKSTSKSFNSGQVLSKCITVHKIAAIYFKSHNSTLICWKSDKMTINSWKGEQQQQQQKQALEARDFCSLALKNILTDLLAPPFLTSTDHYKLIADWFASSVL